jgi:hypothetical protein
MSLNASNGGKEREMELSNEQLHTLRHMLGINTPDDKIPKSYRNYAAVTPGDPEYIELAKIGAVEMYMALHRYNYYRCTEAGKLAAMRSHRDIRKSKAARAYMKFLDVRDAYPDLTFKEFITSPEFARARKEA